MKISPVSGDLLLKVALFAGVGLGALLLLQRARSALSDPYSAAVSFGSGVVTAADDVIAGVVNGVGHAIGVPSTDTGQCEIDIRNGDAWAASFSCPAPRYARAMANGEFSRGSPPLTDLGVVGDHAYDAMGNQIY